MIEKMLIGNAVLCHGSCFDVLPRLSANAIDLAFCDLPYGTTVAEWDQRFPLADFWREIERVVKDDAAIICTAQQPFTAELIMSRIEWFRCEWIWDKVHGTNFANANRHPLKIHESVIVFSRCPPRYFPQKTPGPRNHQQGTNLRANRSATRRIEARASDDLSGMKYPKTIQTFPKHSSQCGFHPTQKPIDLIDYFLQTYSLPGNVVLDPTMGSGSTGVAAIRSGRRFVGIEIDDRFYRVAVDRIRGAEAP